MKHALALANKAKSINEVPVGAVVVSANQIVGEGWNQPIKNNDPTAHAEINALRDAARKINNYRLVDCTLYVTLEPCAMCAGAIVNARVKRVVYGAKDAKTGAVESVFQVMQKGLLPHYVQSEGGLLAEECAELLQAFFKERR